MDRQTRVLVVDDERSIRLFLDEELKQRGYNVQAVESGEEALAAIANQEFDLALIDIRLPGVGGMEVLAALRQRWPDTAVIILTAFASLETSVEALRKGAQDYLFKPCKTSELRESVRLALHRRQQALKQRALLLQLQQTLARNLADLSEMVNPPLDEEALQADEPPDEDLPLEGRFLQHGPLLIDALRHVVTLQGHLLELSPLEFELLSYLAREAPRVVSPRELVRAVQGYDSDTWEARNLIRSHIHHIREKARFITGESGFIRTVRGVGYAIGT